MLGTKTLFLQNQDLFKLKMPKKTRLLMMSKKELRRSMTDRMKDKTLPNKNGRQNLKLVVMNL